MRLRKCFVSLMCDGRLLVRGWMKAERQRDGQWDHHIQRQWGGEDSLAYEFWVVHEERCTGITGRK